VIRSPRGASGGILLIALLGAMPARALEARVDDVVQRGADLWMEGAVVDMFSSGLRAGLARGMPATVALHVELWRRRGAWFDRLENAWDRELRVRYDVWSDQWRLERPPEAPIVTAHLDSVEAEVARPFSLRLAPVSSLRSDTRYYVSFSVTVKPLTVEDAREIEGWLSGEVESKRRAGLGAITAVPISIFDAVRNFVGLGDHTTRAQSPDFTPEDLAARRAPRE
jgi:hypothetical protein